MAKNRIINTKFWIDDYIQSLNQKEKLLFLYFLTNPYTDISGVYEVPLSHICLETNIVKEEISKILLKFQTDCKIFYENGWVYVRNFAKHQISNPKVEKGIELGKSKAPQAFLDRVSKAIIDYDSLPHINININNNININTKRIVGKPTGSTFKKKENNLTFSEKPKVYSLAEEIKKLENSERRDLNIVALFFRYKKPDLKTYEQYQIALTRHLKPAKALVLFDNEQLIKAIEIAKKEYAEIYTLETLLKILTK